MAEAQTISLDDYLKSLEAQLKTSPARLSDQEGLMFDKGAKYVIGRIRAHLKKATEKEKL